MRHKSRFGFKIRGKFFEVIPVGIALYNEIFPLSILIKRAKIKKSSGVKNPLAIQLMAQGLYNHTTVPLTKEEEELELRMNGKIP